MAFGSTKRKRPVDDDAVEVVREVAKDADAANGIPFNIFCSLFFTKMVKAINNAPKGYKAPSSEKARTTLLDACKREVQNNISGVRDI